MRTSPRRFWKSRSRSSILHRAPVRQLAMHWATPGEQWLLPLRHSSSGAWLKPCPWLGIQLGQRLTLTALFAALFAAASSPPHLPMHPRPLQVVARRFTPRRAPDLVALHPRPHLSPPSSPPPPVAPLAATAIAPQSRQWCLCVAVGYAPVQCQVCLYCCGLACSKANYLDTVCFHSALVSRKPLRNRAFAPQNRQISLRGALPRTPLGLAPQTPVLQVVC